MTGTAVTNELIHARSAGAPSLDMMYWCNLVLVGVAGAEGTPAEATLSMVMSLTRASDTTDTIASLNDRATIGFDENAEADIPPKT